MSEKICRFLLWSWGTSAAGIFLSAWKPPLLLALTSLIQSHEVSVFYLGPGERPFWAQFLTETLLLCIPHAPAGSSILRGCSFPDRSPCPEGQRMAVQG